MIKIIVPIEKIKDVLNSESKIFCFGAGRAFENTFCELERFGLEKKIACIADNYLKCQNKIIGKYQYPIVTIDELVNEITKNDLLIITTKHYDEIQNELKTISSLDMHRYCVYKEIIAAQFETDRDSIQIPDKLGIYDEIRIPKKIHYCWFGKNPIPDRLNKCIESWYKYCPDYEIIKWDENNYDINKCEYMKQAYKVGKWAFVSDFARVDLIYQYGGVYLDTDVELLRNIDELLKNDAYCGFESHRYVAFGLGFGAVKGNPIVKRLRDDYEGRTFIQENGNLNLKTCPQYETELLTKYGLQLNGEYQRLDHMTVFPELVLCGMNPYTGMVSNKVANIYSVHHYEGSWL